MENVKKKTALFAFGTLTRFFSFLHSMRFRPSFLSLVSTFFRSPWLLLPTSRLQSLVVHRARCVCLFETPGVASLLRQNTHGSMREGGNDWHTPWPPSLVVVRRDGCSRSSWILFSLLPFPVIQFVSLLIVRQCFSSKTRLLFCWKKYFPPLSSFDG